LKDRDLVNQFLEGRDEKAFLKLYQKHADKLYRTAYLLTKHDAPAAMDIVQETWIVAIEQLEKFQWRSKFSTWLVGILINKWRSYIKHSQKLNEIAESGYSENTEVRMDIAAAIKGLPEGYLRFDEL